MKKNLVSLGIGAFLARLPVYSLPLFFVGIIPNIFSVSAELWSTIEFYVSQLLFLLLSLIIILVFMLIGAKEKRERKLFLFSSILGITFAGGVNRILGTINEMLIATMQRPDLQHIGMRFILVAECVCAAAFAVLIFKAFYKEKNAEGRNGGEQ